MRELIPEEWGMLPDRAGRRLDHAATLLDGELPKDLAAPARADLLPGPGDLCPRCSCPAPATPCRQLAAVYYLVADEVNAYPFVLFELQGRPRTEIPTALRAHRPHFDTHPLTKPGPDSAPGPLPPHRRPAARRTRA
ncbi:hypothetical protein [Amycolatopsis sp. PS_44_ISF1]|uniref:hypothetical protein n=1 Tax=Amycolatopsis sp. PS_44_ISF1 TaxID=2974917 RepID=UPI0028DE3338|nr:hypothetical protein [Amycolatopsis sp. PS_44_ISF1]MDT8914185.1 hypothetical protein [Amycolatopsis sp. PS_44_ISF1]